MTQSQPWDDEPEIEDKEEADGNIDGNTAGPVGDMIIVAVTLSVTVVIWSFLGTVPRPVILIAGLWIMAGTVTSVAEVYAA